MARIDELRFMAKIASLYYTQGLRQTEICQRLRVHQSTVSRVLKKAEREGIVRFTVSLPSGTHTDVENELQARFGLDEAIVVECLEDESQIARDLGAAAAFYLENTLTSDDVIGISCWSSSLLGMVESVHPSQRWKTTRVVQILGGVGNPNAEVHAAQLTRRLADLLGGVATLLPAPGVVGSAGARQVLMNDRFVREVVSTFPSITLALVGIGTTEPSKALASSGNVFSSQELKRLSSKGAVGDICLRFFDSAGNAVVTELDERVISIELEQLQKIKRVVAVAGGRRKLAAIRGALMGKLIKVMITDLNTAEQLLAGNPRAHVRGRGTAWTVAKRAGTTG
jgi:DNA-binding transcriptional regulator LsrR (DeoR family)